MSDGYNGWANYPTWNVALWINNDQGWQESVHEGLRQVADEYRDPECGACDDGETHPVGDYPAYLAGSAVRENVLEVIDGWDTDGQPAGLAADLLGWALDQVDWDEIGAAFLADVVEADTYAAGV